MKHRNIYTFPRFDADIPMRCLKCGAPLRHTSKLIMTSYPIDHILDCPACDEEHCVLFDGVLCTTKDFYERIRDHYDI